MAKTTGNLRKSSSKTKKIDTLRVGVWEFEFGMLDGALDVALDVAPDGALDGVLDGMLFGMVDEALDGSLGPGEPVDINKRSFRVFFKVFKNF